MKNEIKALFNQCLSLVLVFQVTIFLSITFPTESTFAAETTRLSLSSAGVQGNGANSAIIETSISADGRFIAFESLSNNLVSGDTNKKNDIFVRDRATNLTYRVSVSSAGIQGNLNSISPSISADGRFVAFVSEANNLVVGDTNGRSDIFVRDRALGKTFRVSLSSTGGQANASCGSPSINTDGRFVTFICFANNLVVGDTNRKSDIFVRDRVAGKTTRISVSSAGVQSNDSNETPSISADGRFVAFTSFANNLVAGDTNFMADIFVRDRALGKTIRVSLSSAGGQGNLTSLAPSISADGRFVAFQSLSTNLGATNRGYNIYVRDRSAGQTSLVSVPLTGVRDIYLTSLSSSISADGRFVAFDSWSNNQVTSDTNGKNDIFVRDRVTGQTSRISVSSAGAQGNGSSSMPSISADGRFVSFASEASNLVVGDSNGKNDIFVSDRLQIPAITADVTVIQTVSTNAVRKGASFYYTTKVKNLGPGSAANVTLTDLIPLNGRVSLPTLSSSQGSCYRGQTSICRLGVLNAGQQAIVKATFTALNAGIASNRVSVNASAKDIAPLNNTAVRNTTISP